MKKKILIVDDDADVRNVLGLLLSSEYQVFGAATGKEARGLFKKRKPHLTLLDMSLPDASGLDLLKEFLKTDPAAAIVMITANQELAVAREAMKCGACEYVSKPFAAEHVKEVIGEQLRLRAPRK
jgi:DNA-binding NtrC family response regulator